MVRFGGDDDDAASCADATGARAMRTKSATRNEATAAIAVRMVPPGVWCGACSLTYKQGDGKRCKNVGDEHVGAGCGQRFTGERVAQSARHLVRQHQPSVAPGVAAEWGCV